MAVLATLPGLFFAIIMSCGLRLVFIFFFFAVMGGGFLLRFRHVEKVGTKGEILKRRVVPGWSLNSQVSAIHITMLVKPAVVLFFFLHYTHW